MSSSPTGPPKGKKMHQCDFCDRVFSTASNMREHRRTHTGEKPFVCRYCGKAFAQSSTHSKHQLMHKTKEKLRSDCSGGSVRQMTEQRQEQDLSEPSVARLAVSSTSQFYTEPSLLPSKTFIKTLQECKQSKMEVDFYDNLDWRNSNSVPGRQDDTSLQFNNIHDAAITPAPSFNRVKNNEQRPLADQKPIITGMFKNRACEFSPFAESKNLQVKQKELDVKDINFETSSFLTELGLSGKKDPIQYKNAKNETLETPPLFLGEAKTINCDDSKAFHSALPQLVPSKCVSRDDQWNGPLEDTSIIVLDLTSEGEDTLPETQDKFQSNIETFFQCIHCSETFSSLEEHICLAKEAKMFFKCQICQKTFAQYGPFIRHKQSHESPKKFAVTSSSDISIYNAEEYKKCDSIMADNVRKESNNISQITDSLHLRQAKDAHHTVDLLASTFTLEPSRIQSSTRVREDEQNSNDDVIIIEEGTTQTQSGGKDVLESLATGFSFGSNRHSESFLVSVEKNQCSQVKNNTIEIPDSNIENVNNYEVNPREKLSAISANANTNQFSNIEGGYFERSNLSTNDVGKPERRALISKALLKPNVVERKTGNVSHLGKRLAHLKKNPQQIGKKGNPFTCLFCPRKFSTASNMREHTRVHTGERPFSCELCHKKFAQSSTRSKHMRTHTGYKMAGYHLHVKRFNQTKNYKKHLKKTVKHENPKSFLPNRLANITEKPKVLLTKSSSMKTPYNKSYSSLPYPKANQPSLKKYALKMLPETSNNISFPPKTGNNKIRSLTAKLDRRDGANNDNLQFGYNKEGTNRMNVLHDKTDCIVEHNNNQNLKNKMLFSSAVRSDSHISVFGSSSFENSKTQIGHLLPSTTLTVLPRPKSRHRGVHRLLRNAKNYRPFRCTYCPRTFSTSGNMKEHMRTHTGEKPFRCEYCHRHFAQSSTHSKHVQIHIRKQQLNCFFCKKVFSQVALLRRHILMDHKTANENSPRNNNYMSANICGSSNPATVNKNRTGISFCSSVQLGGFIISGEKNQCSLEEKVKKKKIIEIPNSNLGNVSNYEVNSSLTQKRHLEVDLPANHTGFLIHKKNDSFLSLLESEENKTSKDAQEKFKSCFAKESSISKNNLLSSSTAEAPGVTHQIDSEIFGELLSQRAWLATSAKPRIRQHHPQSQIKSGPPSAFDSAQSKADNPETSVIELESSKSLAKETNFYSVIKPLDSLFSVDDFNARKSFRLDEELSNSTSSGDKMVDKIFLNDYSHQNQFIDLSVDEILEGRSDSNQKKPTKLLIGSPQNINEDNLMHYDQILGNSGVELQAKRNTNTDLLSNHYVQNKIGAYNNSFLDKRNQLDYSPFLKSDQLSSSPSSFSGHFTPPALTNDGPADHFPANTQICTKVRNEALHSLSNEQRSHTFVSSRVMNYEQSLGSKISFELASHQIEQSLNSNGNIPNRKTVEQNVPELLNSEQSLNPCSGDPTKRLNWSMDIVPKAKSEREEITSDSVENCSSRILSSKMENSLPEGSVTVLSNSIKLENVFCVETEQDFEAKEVQVENATNSDMTKAVSISDSLDSSFHFNVSNVAANVPYSVTTDIERHNIISINSRPFCDKGETIGLNDELAIDTSLANIGSEEPMSSCTENQQLPLNGMLPNDVDTSSMGNLKEKRKILQRHKIVGKFKCLYCNRCFSTQSNMREHMRVHTGEKPFECIFCFRKFAQSSAHSKHVQTHMRFGPLVCPQCGRRFHRTNNLCQHIRTHHRISHTSSSRLAKKMPLHLDPAHPTAQTSSCPMKQSSNNEDKHIYSADLSENNHGAINILEASSIESSEIHKQMMTNNEESIRKQSHLPFLDNEQTNKEMSDDPPKITTQLILSNDKTKSTIDVDLDKTNFTIDINFPTPNETTENLQDVSFDTINSNLNQSDLPLNQSQNVLPERNNDPKFSSLPPPSLLSSSLCPVSVIEPMKEQKKNSTLHFHRCLFCSKMFDALINVQEYLKTHVGEEPSLQSKYDRKLRKCSTWYKHVEIVLGVKLRLPNRTLVGNAQHLKMIFDVGQRLKLLSHRNLYKCRQCRKECATFQSLLFHRRTHLSKMTGQKILTMASGKLNKRARGPSSFLHKRPTSSLIFSLEPFSSNRGGIPSTVESQQESDKTSLPLLCFSQNEFWLVNLNGTLKPLGPYSRCLPVDNSPMTEIVSCKQNYLWNLADSLQQKSNKTINVSCLEEDENAEPTNKCVSEDEFEWPLRFSLNNLEDNDMKINLNDDDDSKKKGEVLLSHKQQSTGVNSGVIKPFGQEVTTMVSLQLQKCVECGKMFSHVGHFEKHLQIHRGESPFQCNFCLKSFTNFGTFSRHKNLIHLRRNRKSWIPRCRKNKSSCNDNRKESVGSKCQQTKPQSTLDMNLADVDTAYLTELLKKVLGSKSAEVFSDSPFVHKVPSEESTKLSEMMEYPSRFSDKWPTEGSMNLLGPPFQSQASDSNVCVIEDSQSENKESADEIHFSEGDNSSQTARGICATDNLPTKVQIKKEKEDIFSLLNNLKAVPESNTSVKIKAEIFSHNWLKGEVGSKEKMFSSQSSHNVERQVDSKCDSGKEAQINSRVGNDSPLVTNTDSYIGFIEKHSKRDESVECIFIKDDPDDRSRDECCILDVSSSSSQYLLNHNQKTDIKNEIIILSDEENDDNSTPVKMQSLNDGNSMIKLCDSTDVYKSMDMFKNSKSNFPEIIGQNPFPNLNDRLGTVSTTPTTSPLQISDSATNSLKMATFPLRKTSQPQSRSSPSGKIHPCLYCRKICSSSSNLKEHMRSHTGERPFSCGVCHKTFAQKSTLSKHTQIHTRFENPSPSPVGVTMQGASGGYLESAEPTPISPLKPLLGLLEHPSSANRLKIKPVTNISIDPKHTTLKSSTSLDSCKINTDVCGSFNLIDKKSSNINPSISFESDRANIKQSSEIVGNPSSSRYPPMALGIYPLPQSKANVPTCKTFVTQTNPIKPCISDVVPEINVPNKPYLCDVCDRTFTTSGNLKEHRRTHTGERPFECPFCDKTFVQASTRSRHVKNHSKTFC